jgi:hypothetical protein
MDITLWVKLESMTNKELRHVERYVASRLAESPAVNTSTVVARVSFRDGTLQNEKRIHRNKDGTKNTLGPYWYFKHVRDGNLRTVYIGKYDDVEDAKRVVDAKLS